jgi:uncharacterized membrane protein YhiD involved in acid resistance
MALFLSLLLVFTYDKTSYETIRPDHFIQSLILMAIVTAMIMQAIGDSLARSFGIFGALAILRLRISITSPRDVAFIFAAMGAGVACGVYSFLNGAVGIIAFCIIAFILHLTPFSGRYSVVCLLRFDVVPDTNEQSKIEQVIKKFSKHIALKRYNMTQNRESKQRIEYEYKLKLKTETEGVKMAEALNGFEEISNVRLSFNDPNEIQNN